MKEINIQKGYSDFDLRLIVETLKDGEVVVLPTDTVYGLHCLADTEKAIEKIIKIKERPANFGFVHLMKSYCTVHDYAFVSRQQNKFLRTVWPATTRELQNFNFSYKLKPTTVILRSRKNLPAIGRGGLDGLAIRLPHYELLIKIMKNINSPLCSTSLNISGKEEIKLNQINEKLKVKPALVVNAGILAKKSVSGLIDIVNTDKIKIIRK